MKAWVAVLSVLSGVVVMAPGDVRSAPGSLDGSFAPPGNRTGAVLALAEQTDGRILMGGHFGLLRLQTNGALDSTFHASLQGSATGTPLVKAIMLQGDGKLLIGGEFVVPGQPAASNLARLLPDGTADTNFSPGIVPDAPIESIAQQPDSRILIGGRFKSSGATPAPHLARLFLNGQLDPGFKPGSGPDQSVAGIIVQPDGGILIRGDFAYINGQQARGIARLNWDGSLDTNFNTRMTSIPSPDAFALQPDGKILVSGVFSFDLEPPTYHLARLNPNGSVEAVLGSVLGGSVNAIAASWDGKILVGGTFTNISGVTRGGLARLLPTGMADLAFDPGAGITGFNDEEWFGPAIYALLPTRDRKLVLGGNFTQFNGVARAGIARVFSEPPRPRAGSLVLDYVPPFHQFGPVVALAEQPDGRLVAGGYFGLQRLQIDGSFDSGFQPPLGASIPEVPIVRAVALQTDNKVLAGGLFVLPLDTTRSNLARFWPDGTLDTNFNAAVSPNGWVQAIGLQSDGRILIGGGFDQCGGLPRPHIARLLPDGTVDSTFNPGLGPDAVVFGIVVQPDGNILVRGAFQNVNGLSAPVLARLTKNGAPDPSFNVTTIHGSCDAFALQPDGNLIVGGFFSFGREAPRPHVIRLLADGSLDPSFRTDPDDRVTSLALQPDGKALVGGSFTHVGIIPRGGIARLLQNGAVDPGFDPGTGIGGVAVAECCGPMVTAVLVMQNQDVMLGGLFMEYDGVPRSNIARLYSDEPVPGSFVTRFLPYQGALTVRLVAQPPATTAAYAVEEELPEGLVVLQISHGGVFDPGTRKIKFGPFLDADARTLTYSFVYPPWGMCGLGGIYTFEGWASADGVSSPIIGDRYFVVAGCFPADNAPTDNRISMDEVTAYSAAWRRSQAWSVPPSPIPIDYVTRAAFLWRAGECYTVNRAITQEPLWWVPCTNRPVRLDLQTQIVARRALPAAYVPGEALTVTLALCPGNDTEAYALEEILPAGWTLVSTAADAEWDPSTGTIRWGPIFDSAPCEFSYVALPSPDLGGTARFGGRASADGVSALTSGESSLREGCRLTAAGDPRGGFALTLTGRTGQSYLIEVSSNLQTWIPLTSLTNCPASFLFRDGASANYPVRFYRAVPR